MLEFYANYTAGIINNGGGILLFNWSICTNL